MVTSPFAVLSLPRFGTPTILWASDGAASGDRTADINRRDPQLTYYTDWGDAVGLGLAKDYGPLKAQATNFLMDSAEGIAKAMRRSGDWPTPGAASGAEEKKRRIVEVCISRLLSVPTTTTRPAARWV
jgi:hypothetical protein